MKNRKKTQLLLLQDVYGLGRSGDVVSAKTGYVRNYLVPEKKGVLVDKHTLRMRARLQEERAKQAVVDREEAEELAAKLNGFTLKTEVKVDAEGHMYGSVTPLEIAKMMQEKGFLIEKAHILLPGSVKVLGTHTVPLRLKEGVLASFALEVVAEGAPVVI